MSNSTTSNSLTNGLSATNVNVGTSGMVTTNSEAQSNGGGGGTKAGVKPQDVGWQFVPQYYTFLFNSPQRLHCFYTKKSTFIHGVEGEEVKPCFGQQEIDEKIKSLNLNECKTFISSIDAQGSADGGIIIQCIGEMSNNSGPFRKFAQTFFLAEQPNGYFVLNDIFKYLKEEGDDEEEEEAFDGVEEQAGANVVASQQQEEEVVEPEAEETQQEEEQGPEPVQTAAVVIDAPLQIDQTEPEQVQTAVHSEPTSSGAPIKVEEQPQQAVEESSTSTEPEQMQTASEPPAAEEVQLAPVEKVESTTATPATTTMATPSTTSAPPAAPKAAEKPVATPPPPPAAPVQPPKPAGPKTWASLAAAGKTAWGPSLATSAPPAKDTSTSTSTPAAAPAATPAPIVAPKNVQNQGSSAGGSGGQQQQQQQGGNEKGQSGGQGRVSKLEAARNSHTPICFVKLNNWQSPDGTDALDENALGSILKQFGEIHKVEIVKNKACAFVEYKQVESARKAIIASLTKAEGGGGGVTSPDGQKIIVESRKDKEERNTKGGAAGGRGDNQGGRRGPSGGAPNGGQQAQGGQGQNQGPSQTRAPQQQQTPAAGNAASDDQGFIPAGKPARTQQGGNRGGKNQRGGKSAGGGNATATAQK